MRPDLEAVTGLSRTAQVAGMAGAAAARPERTPPWRRLVDGSTVVPPPPPLSTRRIVGRFLVSSVVAVILLLAGGLYLDRMAARHDAVEHAKATTEIVATALVEPHLSEGLLAGDPGATAEFARAVGSRVLVDDIVHLTLRDAEGRLLWTDEPSRTVGRRALREDERAVLQGRAVPARFVDREGPGSGLWQERLLEVQRPIEAPNGQPVLLETFSAYDSVASHLGQSWWRFTVTTVGVLLVMQLIQAPLLRRMLRQLRRSEEERTRLARQAVAASDDERRRIAGDLHDGVVQDLAGTSFLLSGTLARTQRLPAGAVADPVKWTGHRRDVTSALERSVDSVQQAIGALRSLLIEIYPANLDRAGLRRALEGIVRPLENRGATVTFDLPEREPVPPYVEQLFFRVAQEALRNTIKHSGATNVTVSVERAEDAVTLCVADNGVGFDLPAVRSRTEGHFGIKVISDLVRQAGATLDVSTAPGQGTRIRVCVPLPSAET